MSAFRPFMLFTLVLLLGLSCTRDPYGISISVENQGQAPKLGKPIVFTFDKPILSDSFMIGMENPDILKVEPAWIGRMAYGSMHTVEFMPLRMPIPGQSYTFSMTPELLDNVPDFHPGRKAEAIFDAAPLAFEKMEAQWDATAWEVNEMPKVKLTFHFNYPVSSTDLAKLLVLSTSNGQTLTADWGEEQQGKQLTCQITNGESDHFTLNANLNPGLQSVVGGQPMANVSKHSISVVDRSRLTIDLLSTEHNGWSGELEVKTSQPTVLSSLADKIELKPSVKFHTRLISGGFAIVSNDFLPGETYSVTLKSGIEGELGGKLVHEFIESVRFRSMDPSIRFADRTGTILRKNGLKNVKLNIWGCKTVTVVLRKVYANNLLNTIYYDYNSVDDGDQTLVLPDYSDDYHYLSNMDRADEVWRKTFTVKDMPTSGNGKIVHLDIEDQVPIYHGMYVMELESPEMDYWDQPMRIINLTDIGLMAKKSHSQWMVFANSIQTGQPIAGLPIRLVGHNNQTVATITTQSDGVATYTLNPKLPSGFEVEMICAERQGDFSYLWTEQHQIETSRFDIEGSTQSASGFTGMLYGERNIYRPGETVNLAAIVRTASQQSPGAIPVKIELSTPDYARYKILRKTLSAQGATDAAFDIPLSAPTGTWTASLLAANDVLIHSTEIKIEEFMPDRLKSSLTLGRDTFFLGDTLTAQLEASSFFGPPAAGRSYHLNLSLSTVNFSAPQFANFQFNSEDNYRHFPDQHWEGELDSLGKGEETWEIPNSMLHSGVVEGIMRSTIFDETGRPVHRRKHFTLHTQQHYFGIAKNDYYCATGKPIQFSIIALNPQGQPVSTQAEVRVIREDYISSISSSSNYFRYDSQKKDTILFEKNIQLSAQPTPFTFVPDLSGRYEIQVREPGSARYISTVFWSYGQGKTTFTSFRINRDGHIDITLDKPKYKVGETAKILLKGPFSGRMLVTIESHEVLRYYQVQSDHRAAEILLPITAAMAPNVHVTATLIKPHMSTDIPLTVAHGVAPIAVENPATHLPLAIEAQASSPSRQKQTIRIRTAPNATVTISAVDEGILQVGKMETPNPHAYFYQKRGMSIEWYDHYKYLLPELAPDRSATGGDGYGLENRLNPLANRRVKLVSYWSGTRQADASGNLQFTIDIPQFSGSIRLMAIAHKGAAFAHAERQMRVADPIVISVALPRVLAPSDTLEMPVFISNTEGKPTQAQLQLSLEGPIKVVSEPSSTVELEANREKRLNYRLVALPNVGECKVTVQVNAFGKTFRDETEITVRPHIPLQSESGSGEAKGGETASIPLKNTTYLPATVRGNLLISRSPMVQFTQSLEEVVRYPHGCLEQTVSAAFPQLYYSDLVQSLYQATDINPNVDHHIRFALQKLMLMQRYDGGLSYWPGAGTESWWGSVWAAHFVVEAEKAGFEVDPGFRDNLLQYLSIRVNHKTTEEWFFDHKYCRLGAPREVPYSLYVLALAGQPDWAMMNYYKSRPEMLRTDGKYLLSAAYALSGEMERGVSFLPKGLEPMEYSNPNNASFASILRDQALALNVLIEIDPNHPQIPFLAQQVSKSMKQSTWRSTQENAFGLVALGKLARRSGSSSATAEVWQGDKKIADFNGKTLRLTQKQFSPQKPITLKTTGAGPIYWFWETQGVPTTETRKTLDNQIFVRRQYYRETGQEIKDGQLTQNELVVVKLTVASGTGQSIPNVAITDVLPACLEIENPRLHDLQTYPFMVNPSHPTHRDIRDDRISLFDDITVSPKQYYYLARVVSLGHFRGSYVSADAMYDGTIHSFQGGGKWAVVQKGKKPI